MGKVYRYSDIAQKAVPRAHDFAIAKGMFHDGINKAAEQGTIYGSIDFGSIAVGTPNERSDYDALVVAQDLAAIQLLHDICDPIRRETRVAIEPIFIQETLAKAGIHSVDHTFITHIQGIPPEGNVAGENPLSILRPFDLSATKVHEQYLAQKLRRLAEGTFTNSEEDRLRVFQRALEAPINVGRRMLQVLPFVGYELDLPSDNKLTVSRTFQNIYRDTPLLPGFNFLLQQDAAYTALLQQALRDEITGEEYEKRVREMTGESITAAYSWIADVALHYNSLLEGNPSTPEGNHHAPGKESY